MRRCKVPRVRIDDAAHRAVLLALANVGLADTRSISAATSGPRSALPSTPDQTPATPPAADFHIEPLAGGLGGRSYAASAGGGTWVVRVPNGERSGAVDIETEARITRDAAALGIAPRVIGTDPHTGALVTEYLRGASPVAPAALKTPENIQRAARLLRRLHTIRPVLRPFDPEAFEPRGLTLDAAQRRLAVEFHELAHAYKLRHRSVVLCHNDLVSSNILDDGELKLVDFEYAVQAAPVLDIAGLAALNDLDHDERWRLAEAYYEGAVVPFTYGELVKVVRLVRLIAYFWCVATAATAEDRAPYDAFAERVAAALAD